MKNYLELTNQIDNIGNRLSTNSDSSGRFHSNWLNMIYPRLKLAKNLLHEEGIIFISIDDNEVHNLRKLCDEIFGENSFVAELPRSTTIKGKNDEKKIASSHDYVLVYSNITTFTRNNDFRSINRYKLEDSNGKYYVEATLDSVSLPYSENLDFEINFDGNTFTPIVYNGKKTSWRWSRELVDFGIANDLIVNKNGRLYTKTYLEFEITKDDGKYALVKKEIGGTHRSQMLLDYKYSNNEASRSIKDLKIPFDYSKPVELIKKLITLIPNDGEMIILDFFAGSSTTAHAVMQFNADDGHKRKYIMVQLPEPTPIDSDAYKVGFKTISEIGKERIRRAGDKILQELKEKQSAQKLLSDEVQVSPDDLDIGFKVFKLDTSNIKTWDSSTENIEQTLLDSVSNIKSERSQEDVLYEVLLKYGLDLTLPIEEFVQNGKKLYSVGFGALIVCLDDNIDISVAEKIVEIKDSKKPETMNVIFKDNGFKDDVVKTNTIQLLTKHGVESVRSI